MAFIVFLRKSPQTTTQLETIIQYCGKPPNIKSSFIGGSITNEERKNGLLGYWNCAFREALEEAGNGIPKNLPVTIDSLNDIKFFNEMHNTIWFCHFIHEDSPYYQWKPQPFPEFQDEVYKGEGNDGYEWVAVDSLSDKSLGLKSHHAQFVKINMKYLKQLVPAIEQSTLASKLDTLNLETTFAPGPVCSAGENCTLGSECIYLHTSDTPLSSSFKRSPKSVVKRIKTPGRSPIKSPGKAPVKSPAKFKKNSPEGIIDMKS